MQIPHDLQHFPEPTLIVIADHLTAKFFLAGGDAVQELDGVALPRDRRTDKDTAFVDVDSGRVSSGEPKDEEERLNRYGKLVAVAIERYLHQHTAAHFYLVMVGDVADAVKRHLDKPAHALIKKEIAKDVMKEPLVDVLRRLFA